jgi:membrane protease subunit HflC
MRWMLPVIVLVVVLAAIFGPQFFFTVDQTQYVIITRFGEIKRVELRPGLYTKTPFVDTVIVLDNRLLRIDLPVTAMPDVSNQFLNIDAYLRYRIVDPRAFRENLINEATGASRISSIVIAELREQIGRRTQQEIIGARIILQPDDTTKVEPLLTTDNVATRTAITRVVRDRTQIRAAAFGVKIEDVRIRGADFPQATEANIFNRMRTERDVQAKKLRAEGEQEYLNITANVDRQVTVIGAEADQTSSQLRGEGEAEAIRLLAQALGQDAEFYAFLRSLDAYRLILTGKTTAVLSADSDLFRYLQSSDPPPAGE